MSKKVLVLGASGRTGGYIVDGLLRRGLSVVALVRDPSTYTPPASSTPSNLHTVRGTPQSLTDVSAALTGCDSVITALALSRSGDSPFASLTSPPFSMRDALAATITAMQQQSVKRLVVVSSWGVADDYPNAPFIFRAVLYLTPLRHVFADHDAVDAEVRKSGLDWTLSRPVGFTTTDDTAKKAKEYATSAQLPGGLQWIHRRMVADWVVDALDNRATVHQAPVIAQA